MKFIPKTFFILVLSLVLTNTHSWSQDNSPESLNNTNVAPSGATETKITEPQAIAVKQEEPQPKIKKNKPQKKKLKKPYTKKIKHKKLAKQIPLNPTAPIDQKLILKITLSQNECESLMEKCIYRDSFFEEPYYHKTIITIFDGKIIAEQFSKMVDNQLDSVLMAVKDGNHQVATNYLNLISFKAQNGVVSDLKLLQGNLEKERQEQQRCETTEGLYKFSKIYKSLPITEKLELFKNEESFNGLGELILFYQQPEQVMAVIKHPNNGFKAIENLRLCKTQDSDILLVKPVDDPTCMTGHLERKEECQKYSVCNDYLLIKNCEVMSVRNATMEDKLTRETLPHSQADPLPSPSW